MLDLLDQLRSALGGTYRISHELTGGGMSRVFAAEETGLGRLVAIKVLPPALAAAVSVDRFRREIQLAASLQHPHIVPLHSAGHADGILFYTMPLVEGESLRARLTREGALPAGVALRILRDVVDALAYAHEHGVLHRDIKPDNVLVTRNHALVTDFGVARALSASASGSAIGTLTSEGVALGTPAYMAPEQAAADPQVDQRADIYSVGVLAYEMLAGHTPFRASSPHRLLAAHANEAPDPLGQVRPDVPPALAAVVMRCLAKSPADRWQRATELLAQLEEVSLPGRETAPTQRIVALRVRRTRVAWFAAALIAVVVAAVGVARIRVRRLERVPTSLSPDLVVVTPFRVAGADPQLVYLSEGMVDLLATQLTGEGGPRAVDTRAALAAWRAVGGGSASSETDAAVDAARRLGAAQVIEGSVVGNPQRLVLSAALRRLPGGESPLNVRVEGPADSLPALVDRLTAQLLAGRAGGRERSTLQVPLAALRAYLDGLAAYRRGSYNTAVERFRRALDLDSTFASAALAFNSAAGWVTYDKRGARLAWTFRDHLSPPERLLFRAQEGPRYPQASSLAEQLAARDSVALALPDNAEALYYLGDSYFHFGRALEIKGSWERAVSAFNRALELDSTFAGPLQHLIELAQRDGDTAAVRRYGKRYLQTDSSAETADYIRWHIAQASGDSVELQRLHDRLPQMTPASRLSIWQFAQEGGMGLVDAERIADVEIRRAGPRNEQTAAAAKLSVLALNRGQPLKAARAPWPPGFANVAERHRALGAEVIEALYWGGDTAMGPAVRELAAAADAPLSGNAEERDQQLWDACVLQQWQLAHGDRRTATRAAQRLRASANVVDSLDWARWLTVCAHLLEAWLAVGERHPSAAATLDRLDSLLLTGPVGPVFGRTFNLALARLFEQHGSPDRALAAARRRIFFFDQPRFLSTYLREEGHLAAVLGDREGAIRAYQHYLALRREAEPSVRPEVERVKEELARLLRESR